MNHQNEINEFSVNHLISDNAHYIIPIYQRNYEWQKDEIEELINDIETARHEHKKHYYIGSLVVLKRDDGNFEVIDGQQRLTTLTIILKVLSNNINCLYFEHRQSAQNALDNYQDSYQDNHQDNHKPLDECIVKGFEYVKNKLAHINNNDFAHYLMNNVIVLRTQVPTDTNLNHYFEIMNTRGEQLEKHEVLKARLMKKLKANEQKAFGIIWNACSDMSRFAVSGFAKPELREKLFGNDFCQIPEFDKVVMCIEQNDKNFETKSIKCLIQESNNHANNKQNSNNDDKNEDGHLESIIDFANFLMHCLSIWQKHYAKELGDVSLDDKKLLSDFECINDEKKVKEFASVLLKCRLLFDYYVLKMDNRSENNGRWAILKPSYSKEKSVYAVNCFGDDWQLKTVQSMFQVSFTAKNYKQWLQKTLRYLYKQSSIDKDEYLTFLNKLAFNEYQSQKSNLSYPKITHYVLNYLDYLIVCCYRMNNNNDIFPSDKNRVESDIFKELENGLKSFEFFNRSSVEHYYPQSTIKNWSDEMVNSLGNLCLIGHSYNSTLSNRLPNEKRIYVLDRLKTKTAESAKQLLMMMYQDWSENNAKEHEKKMLELLENGI